MKNAILGFATLVIVLLPAWADEPKKKPAEGPRDKYARQSAEILKIVEPIKISNVYYWKDGGSLGIELTDAKGTKHLFALDGGGLPTKDSPRGVRPQNLYMGVTYPTNKAGKMVAYRGPEEAALYGVLLRWANKHPQRAALYDEKIELNRKDHGNLWEARSFFLRLDARFANQ